MPPGARLRLAGPPALRSLAAALAFSRRARRARAGRAAGPGRVARLRRDGPEDRARRAHRHAARDRRQARRGRLGDGGRAHGLPPGEPDRVRALGRADGDSPAVRRRRALHRREDVPAARRHHAEHAAAERQHHAGRHAVRHDRSVQLAPRGLLLRRQRERRAIRRPLSQRVGVLQRLGHDLLRRDEHRRRRLHHRVRDPVQVDLVRSEHRHLGPELLALDSEHRRGQRVGVAQPALGSEHRGPDDGPARSRSGHRARHRSVGEHDEQACGPHRHAGHVGVRLRAVARPLLQDHAAAQRVAHDQHGLLRDRGRRPPGEPHAVRAVLPGKARLLPARGGHLRVRPDRSERRHGSLSNAERQNARPFFSRRIGLGNLGEPVDLEYGGKVSGRVGRFDIGALSIRQDENVFPAAQGREPAGADCVPSATAGRSDCRVAADTLSVVRAKASIGAESTVGAVFTNGDPLSNVDNSLAGVDFLYRNSRLPGGRTIEAGAWYQQSDTEGLVGEDAARGLSLSIPSNAKFRGGLSVREVEANFNPALGFISRRDVRDYQFQLAYTHRPGAGYWQQMFWSLDGQRIEKLARRARVAVRRAHAAAASRTARATTSSSARTSSRKCSTCRSRSRRAS